MPKRESAWYNSESQGRWVEVRISDLTDAKIPELRTRDLRDTPDGKIELGVRKHESTPHFYRKPSTRHILGNGSGGEGEAHRNECRRIHELLSGSASARFGFYYWSNGVRKFETVTLLENYSWKLGGNIGILKGKRYVPDILGRSDAIDLLDNAPLFAIEVVDTHFLDFETFDAAVYQSRHLPIIIAFIFLSANPKCNQVKKLDDCALIRTGVYIHDGSFWVDGSRVEEKLPDNLELPVFYEEVKSGIQRMGLIRTD